MALKFFKLEKDKNINVIEKNVIEGLGLGFRVSGDKIYFDENRISADRSSTGAKSKKKGSTFERNIVKILNEWWSGNKLSEDFQRTPRSGAWKFPEDIIPPRGCPFLISCKNSQEWDSIENTLSAPKHVFKKWWDELYESRRRVFADRTFFEQQTGVEAVRIIPILFFTRNSMPNYVMMLKNYFLMMEDRAGKFNKRMLEIKMDDAFVMMLVSDFLAWFTKENVEGYVREGIPEA
jgi:hypothetical protein